MAVLCAKGIKKQFGGVVALKNGNLSCEKGRITGLLGANGSGKSTISKIIIGLYSADGGEIYYNDEKVQFRNPIDAKNAGISMVFQNLSLVPDLTVWQNIVLGMEKKRGLFLENASARKRARELVDRFVPGMDIDQRVCDLGPGEMQIVEIVKAIQQTPKVLIFDEATAALEFAQVQSLFNYMRELAAEGVAIVFTSHRLWEIMEICDDIVVFRNGEDVGYVDFANEDKDINHIVEMITGDAYVSSEKKTRGKPADEVMLSVNGLQYGKYIRNIDIELHRGEVLGIGGLANQGQNELMLALAGFYKKIKGSAKLNGANVPLNSTKRLVRAGMLLVPGDRQQQGLYMKESVYTNIANAKLGLKRQPLFTPRKKYREETEQIVRQLSIKTDGIDTPVSNLSGGNQQKVVVGKWLPFDINVLLLADPAKGVDVGAKRDLYRFIMDLVRDKRMSVILYASDNEELVDYCDRVLIMYEGSVVSELKGDEISEIAS